MIRQPMLLTELNLINGMPVILYFVRGPAFIVCRDLDYALLFIDIAN